MKKNKFGLAALSLLSLSLFACGKGNVSGQPSISAPASVTESPSTSNTETPSSNSASIKDEVFIPEEEATGGLVFTPDATNSYYIVSDYLSVEYDIVIPSVYQGLPVREIGEGAFRYATIDSLRIPSSVQKIGKEAFLGLETDGKLEELNLPEGLIEIDDGAFQYCPGLTSIILPSTLTTLGSGVFHLCSAIKKVKVNGGKNFRSASNVLYSYNRQILYFYPAGRNFTSFDLPSSVKEIADYAFYGNNTLTAIGIPTNSNLTTIGYRSLAARFSLTSIRLENATKLTTVGDKCLSENKALTRITLPASLTALSAGMLYKDSSLTNVTIKGTYTKIPDEFVRNCSKLTSFQIPSGVDDIGEKAFFSCGALKTLTLPSTVKKIGKSAFGNCTSLTSINIPEGVTEIPEALFAYDRALSTLSLPTTISSIGSHAFTGRQALKAIDLSKTSVKEIPDATFLECIALTDIKLPETLETIGDIAFKSCEALPRIKLTSKVATIGEEAFFGCSSLLYVYLPKSVKSIGAVAFRTTYATEGLVKLYFEADSFVNADTTVGDNFTNGTKFFGKTVADYETDSRTTNA